MLVASCHHSPKIAWIGTSHVCMYVMKPGGYIMAAYLTKVKLEFSWTQDVSGFNSRMRIRYR